MPKIYILIPARMESSRFPGKPLAKINGKEMIVRVLERCTYNYDVFAIVNDLKISNVIQKNGFKHILIKENCKTGTDRIGLALKKLKLKPNDLIINVQGDEPMVNSSMIDKVIQAKLISPDYVINSYTKIKSEEEYFSSSTIKMVFNKNEDLIYASRAPIPASKNIINLSNSYKQVCIYAFSCEQLSLFIKTKRGPIEKNEDIEILRFLENSICRVKMVNLGDINLHAVDNPEDIRKVEKMIDY